MHFYIHNCVTEMVECGTSYKYTNIQNFYSVKYYKHVTKHYYRSSSHKHSSAEQKECIFKYFV